LNVRSFGQDVTQEAEKEPDWNKFVLTTLSYSHDLGPATVLESSFLGYYAQQEQLSEFDLGLAEILVGPRFALPAALSPEASIKLYAIGTISSLAEHRYYSGLGGGVSTRFNVGNFARLEPSYEYRRRDYESSELYPTAGEQTGKLHIAAITGDGSFFGWLPWVSRIATSWNRTDDPAFDFNSYDRVAADIGFPIPFSLALAGTPHQFFFTPAVGGSRTDYAQPNPAIDPAVARLDKEWHVSASLDTQIYGSWGIRLLVQYTETLSNLPNFDMDNLSVSIGPTLRF
jgi:hypothetical protein